jgi:CCR4-NOT transcription complex subunit 7/8
MRKKFSLSLGTMFVFSRSRISNFNFNYNLVHSKILTRKQQDTEFPGVVARPIGEFPTKASYHYQTLRANVDLLKMIQLGITLFNIEGAEVPPSGLNKIRKNPYPPTINVCPCTWSFNFRFDLSQDMCNEESVQLLKKAGFDFEKLANLGIDPLAFGARLVTSGLAYSDDVHWISFHSGYDFGYLTKLIWNQALPENEDDYRKKIQMYFPNIWDVKYMLRHAQSLARRGVLGESGTRIIERLGTRSGLQDLADELACVRIGTQHQAASDAWLTGAVFWSMKAKVFDSKLPDNLNGQMWGLTGVGAPASTASQAAALAVHHAGNAAGGPSTPTTHTAGLASTPGPGPTPGGGVFGHFSYGK